MKLGTATLGWSTLGWATLGWATLGGSLMLASAACSSGPDILEQLDQMIVEGERMRVVADQTSVLRPLWYLGPGVPPGTEATGRFVEPMVALFAEDEALQLDATERGARAVGPMLRSFGYGGANERLELIVDSGSGAGVLAIVRGREVVPARGVVLFAESDERALERLLRVARASARALGEQYVVPPAYDLAFVVAQDAAAREALLARAGISAFAALELVLGDELETSGVPTHERPPDPALRTPLGPDPTEASTRLDNSRVSTAEPSALDAIVRLAAIDVGLELGAEPAAERPFGGAAMDAEGRVPTARLGLAPAEGISAEDLSDRDTRERQLLAIAAVAVWAAADPRPSDFDRYLGTWIEASRVRETAAAEAGLPELELSWRHHAVGARSWLRTLCLHLVEDDARAALELRELAAPAN